MFELWDDFKKDFSLACKVAETRVVLAKRPFEKDKMKKILDDEKEYAELKKSLRNWDSDRSGLVQCIGRVFGSAYGNYTNFCFFRFTLSKFDDRIERDYSI